MVNIPSDIRIRVALEPGSVFYFEEETLTSPEPHYFVVLNNDPQTDLLLLLVFSSSQITKVKARNVHNNPDQTLVEVSPAEYSAFSKDSIFDCNTVMVKSVNDLVQKLDAGKLKLKPNVSSEILGKLRIAVKASPAVPEAQKRILE